MNRMNKYFLIIFLTLVQTYSFSQADHQIWTELLRKHVSNNGHVDYKGFIKDSFELNKYPVSYTHLTLPTNREV